MKNNYIKENFKEKDYDKVRNLRNKARRAPHLHLEDFEKIKKKLHLKND